MNFYDKLLLRKKLLEKYASLVLKSIEKEPEGSIKVQRKKNYSVFYFASPEDCTDVKYISKKNTKLIASLLQKRYNHWVLKEAETQIKTIERFLKKYDEKAVANILLKLNKDCRKYIKAYELPDDIYVEQWLAEKYVGNTHYEIKSEYETLNGEKVRSKSEIIIANCLRENHIPYKYECPFSLTTGHTIYPDFTILNRKTHEVVLWEHFGRMDDIEYRSKAFKKINEYALSEIVPGKGLIVTFEDSNNPLNVMTVKQTIRALIE